MQSFHFFYPTLKPIGDLFWEEGSNLVEHSTDTPVLWKLVSAPSVKCCRESCIGTPTPQTCIGYIFHLTEKQCILKMTQKIGKTESDQEAKGSSFAWMKNISKILSNNMCLMIIMLIEM